MFSINMTMTISEKDIEKFVSMINEQIQLKPINTNVVISTEEKITSDYLLSVSEVAELLKTNKNMIYTLVDKKLLRAMKVGSLKIRNSEVIRFLDEYEGKDLTNLDNIKLL